MIGLKFYNDQKINFEKSEVRSEVKIWSWLTNVKRNLSTKRVVLNLKRKHCCWTAHAVYQRRGRDACISSRFRCNHYFLDYNSRSFSLVGYCTERDSAQKINKLKKISRLFSNLNVRSPESGLNIYRGFFWWDCSPSMQIITTLVHVQSPMNSLLWNKHVYMHEQAGIMFKAWI